MEAASGDVPLTPIQRWFFARELRHRNRWNQSVVLEVDPRVTPGMLQQALQATAAEHDVLRFRYAQLDEVTQRLAAPEECVELLPCAVAIPPDGVVPSIHEGIARWISRLAQEAHAGLDLRARAARARDHFPFDRGGLARTCLSSPITSSSMVCPGEYSLIEACSSG